MAAWLHLLLIAIFMSSALLAMEDNLLIEHDQMLKIVVAGRKLSVSHQAIRAHGGPLLNDLIDNPPKISKKDKFFSGKRPKLDCSLGEFNLAYLFITKGILSRGYFTEKARNAAQYFSLPEMEKYIAKHPPLFSGHYLIAWGDKCPYCDYGQPCLAHTL